MGIGAGAAVVAWGVPDTAETIESAMSGDDDMDRKIRLVSLYDFHKNVNILRTDSGLNRSMQKCLLELYRRNAFARFFRPSR